VDDEGVTLGDEARRSNADTFFVRSWNEEGTERSASENMERVKVFDLVRE
jgi:hypothetical protein